MPKDSHLDALIAAIHEIGGSVGDIKLRENLGWDEYGFDAVGDKAIALGKLVAWRGRGGMGYRQNRMRQSRRKVGRSARK